MEGNTLFPVDSAQGYSSSAPLMEMRLLMVYGLFAHLLIACKEAPTPHDGLLFPPGKSHLAKVRVLNYTDSFQTLSVEANFAEVQDKSTESMFFTGNTQMISYPSDGIEPNMLWADSLRANFRSETLLSAGNCVLVPRKEILLRPQIYILGRILYPHVITQELFLTQGQNAMWF